MSDPQPAPHWRDHDAYVSMTMEFRCNLKCVHCMIEGTMDRLEPESDRTFEDLLAFNARERRWKGLILTGSEITLRKDLPDLASKARASGFDHVRIQTHGAHLADRAFTERLVAAGIDEFFVSVTGSDGRRHDGITGVPRSFERMMAGLAILDGLDVSIMTNTVVTTRSHADLPAIVDTLSHVRRLKQMEFWIYWPMKEDDDKDLVASYQALLPDLDRAVSKALALGRAVEIKNVPQCLLGAHRNLLRNDQPQLMIDEAFWAEFSRNGFHQCHFRERCVSRECLGLSTAYIRKFGLEAAGLQPIQSLQELT